MRPPRTADRPERFRRSPLRGLCELRVRKGPGAPRRQSGSGANWRVGDGRAPGEDFPHPRPVDDRTKRRKDKRSRPGRRRNEGAERSERRRAPARRTPRQAPSRASAAGIPPFQLAESKQIRHWRWRIFVDNPPAAAGTAALPRSAAGRPGALAIGPGDWQHSHTGNTRPMLPM